MKMRPSCVLQKLRQGEVVSCFKVNVDSHRVAEIPAMLGFDCIWIDMEHTTSDWSVIEKQILVAKAYNTDAMVRVCRRGYNDYIKPLELDASGIMVPHVMSLADAQSVVRTTRFHPVGRRPVDGGNADGAYCNIDFVKYLEQANNQRFVMIQIEDPEPLDELDAIASVEGIDLLFFGPGDFSHGIGAPGQWDHPRLIQARKQVAEAALRHGKAAGTMGSHADIKELIDMGYRFINIGADVGGLSAFCKTILTDFKEVVANKKKPE